MEQGTDGRAMVGVGVREGVRVTDLFHNVSSASLHSRPDTRLEHTTTLAYRLPMPRARLAVVHVVQKSPDDQFSAHRLKRRRRRAKIQEGVSAGLNCLRSARSPPL